MAERRRESRRRFGEKQRQEKQKERQQEEKRREGNQSGKPGKPEKSEKSEKGAKEKRPVDENGETGKPNGETGEPSEGAEKPTEETTEEPTVETEKPNGEPGSHPSDPDGNPASPIVEPVETGETEDRKRGGEDLSSFSESQQAFIARLREAVEKREVSAVRSLLRQCRQQRLCFGKKRKHYVLAVRPTVAQAEELLRRTAEQERFRREYIEAIEESENLKPFVGALGSDRFGHTFFLFPHDFNNLFFLSPSQDPSDRFVETLFREGAPRDAKTRASSSDLRCRKPPREAAPNFDGTGVARDLEC